MCKDTRKFGRKFDVKNLLTIQERDKIAASLQLTGDYFNIKSTTKALIQ